MRQALIRFMKSDSSLWSWPGLSDLPRLTVSRIHMQSAFQNKKGKGKGGKKKKIPVQSWCLLNGITAGFFIVGGFAAYQNCTSSKLTVVAWILITNGETSDLGNKWFKFCFFPPLLCSSYCECCFSPPPDAVWLTHPAGGTLRWEGPGEWWSSTACCS